MNDLDTIGRAVARATAAIPPLWPLAATVAVNPFLGQVDEPLALTATRLARAAGVRVTPSPAYFAAQLATGALTDADLAAALDAAPRDVAVDDHPADVAALRAALSAAQDDMPATPTVADLARDATGRDWPAIVADRFGHWAGGFLDAGQALWSAPRGSAWTAWRASATHDLTPEILGLDGFAAFVAASPPTPDAAIARAIATLGVPDAAVEPYCHRLLVTLGGWAQAARQREWVAGQAGTSDDAMTSFLAIRLLWEEALLLRFGDRVATAWNAALVTYAAPLHATAAATTAALGQDALDHAAQRNLAVVLATPAPAPPADRRIQAAFCIDVRSEVFRRALEAADPTIQTLGFAGFFGLATAHRSMASDVVELRLPVLLTPALTTHTGVVATADTRRRLLARAARAWDRFKLAAVSSFAFVEATGPAYVVKLVRDALAIGDATAAEPPPCLDVTLALEARVATAEAVLRAMSLTRDFAPLVVLVGHGARTINNPHASALHCGACGGYPGDVNARLLATLLNDPEVRQGLAARGIAMPATTHVVAALHDTTGDLVELYDDAIPASHANAVAAARRALVAAGQTARAERARRLPHARTGIIRRSRDWAEVRPEWGLAGCNAFIAAPRARTIGRDFGGRVFLHDYDWADDTGFGVLEMILTAPVVVASWISLQYYGSSTAPELFGGGNKLLHNVVGGIGVVEGNGGTLRGGLPWQSVHDGVTLVHAPQRLTVIVEAPREAILAVLARHDHVRQLFDNHWLHLIVMDDAGRLAWRFAGGTWEPISHACEVDRPTATVSR